MTKRSLNPNLVKIHRSYTVEEVADLYGVHKNTVRIWVKKNGLPICDDRKPMLILGRELKAFLRQKKAKGKQKCQPWEFYCFRCRKPQPAAAEMVEYVPETSTKGRLSALCPVCEGIMNKYAGIALLELLEAKLDISLPRRLKRIDKRDKPLLNSDFNH